MGIYTRDNINYSTMLQNAIANRAKAAEREAAYIQNKGKLWGDTVSKVGNMFGRGLTDYVDEQDRQSQLDLMNKRYEDSVQYQQDRDAKLYELLALKNKMLNEQKVQEQIKPNVEPEIVANPLKFSEQPTSTYGYQFNQYPAVPLEHELPSHNPTINSPILPTLGIYDDTPYRRNIKPSDFNEYLELINYRGI